MSIFKNQGGVNFKTYVNYLNTRGGFFSIAKNRGEVNFNVARLLINYIITRQVFCQFLKTKAKSTSMWRAWQFPISINRGGVNFNVCDKALSISKNRGEAFCQFLKTEARLFVDNFK